MPQLFTKKSPHLRYNSKGMDKAMGKDIYRSGWAIEQLGDKYALEAEFVNIFLPAQCTYIFLSLNSWNNESISDFVLPQVFSFFFNLLYRSLYRSQFVILFFSLPFFTFLIEAFCMHIFWAWVTGAKSQFETLVLRKQEFTSSQMSRKQKSNKLSELSEEWNIVTIHQP